MSASTAAPSRAPRESWPLLLAAAAAAIYALGHLGWYLQTPLGRVPVLDEREGITFANALVAGHLPTEPFYRAPGYGLLLAALRFAGVSANGLFSAALLMGVLFHVLTAIFTARIARIWFDRRAAVIAGLLVASNPVLIHFATQAGDTTPALACFAAGVACLAPQFATRDQRAEGVGPWVGASLCWAAATVLRPNYFLVWLALPVLAVLDRRNDIRTAANAQLRPPESQEPGQRSLTAATEAHSSENRGPRFRLKRLFAAFAGAVLFAAIGAWQFHLCGRFGFLPSQGAYNLWAANEPGANGRYFTQKVSLPAAVAERNPTRAESLILYQRETGKAATDFRAVNAYWRHRFIEYVAHRPFAWLGLLLRKSYALLNDWEQYNNETPAFHLALSPWLRWNPLSWGILLVIGTTGIFRLVDDAPRAANALGWIAGAAAASALLFFVSARFRLPLTVLLSIAAGGALSRPVFWRTWSRTRQFSLGVAGVLAAVVAFSNFDHVRDRATFVQDHALLARAAATTGDDLLAWKESEAALAMRADHPDALRLAVASYFNLLLTGKAPAADEPRWRAAALRYLSQNPAEPDLRAVAAVALWRAGEAQPALAEWRSLGRAPSAIAARLLAHDTGVTPADLTTTAVGSGKEPLVQLASAVENGSTGVSDASLRATAQRVFETRDIASHP